MITREETINGYMINEKHVIAEMLYDTITKYEEHIKSLEAQSTNTEQLTCKNCYHSTIHNELFRSCRCVSLIDEDGEPTNIVPNEFYCSLHHPKDTQ